MLHQPLFSDRKIIHPDEGRLCVQPFNFIDIRELCVARFYGNSNHYCGYFSYFHAPQTAEQVVRTCKEAPKSLQTYRLAAYGDPSLNPLAGLFSALSKAVE
jgi:hypothetical protein